MGRKVLEESEEKEIGADLEKSSSQANQEEKIVVQQNIEKEELGGIDLPPTFSKVQKSVTALQLLEEMHPISNEKVEENINAAPEKISEEKIEATQEVDLNEKATLEQKNT